MPSSTLRVARRASLSAEDAERPERHSHAERGNEGSCFTGQGDVEEWRSARSLAIPALFRRQDVRDSFGELSIIVLNPVAPLRDLNGEYSSLKEATADNCRKAGRSEGDIEKRVNSIDDQEAPEVVAWLEMLELGGIEFPHWPFPEYRYQTDRIATLVEARKTLVERLAALEWFFKTEDEIRKSV